MNKHAARAILPAFLIAWNALAIWMLPKPTFQVPDEFVYYVMVLFTTKAFHTLPLYMEIDNTELDWLDSCLAGCSLLSVLPLAH